MYKPRLVGVFDKHMTWGRGQGKFVTDEHWAKGPGIYQWETSNDQGQELYICQIHTVLAVVDMIYTMETSH